MNASPNTSLHRTPAALLLSRQRGVRPAPVSSKPLGVRLGMKGRTAVAVVAVPVTFLVMSTTLALPMATAEPKGRVIFTAAQVELIKAHNTFLRLEGPFWTPQKEEVAVLEQKLGTYLVSHTFPVHEQALAADVAKGWPAYHVQYFGHTEKGKRLIYLNALCNRSAAYHRDWDKDYVIVMDGGPCYFQASYDPVRREILRLWVNGYA